jgi:hypothetical protein
MTDLSAPIKNGATWTIDDVQALGLTTDVVTAGKILGLGRNASYDLARNGGFPFPVLRLGSRYVVAVPHLLESLGAGGASSTVAPPRHDAGA